MVDLLRPTNFIILAVTLYGVEIVRRVLIIRKTLAGIGNLPGTRATWGASTLLSIILPQIPYITLPPGWQLKQKYGLHEKYGSDVVSCACLFDVTNVAVWIADAALAKEIMTNRAEYPKPYKMFTGISIYGPNIVAADFDDWKRHRRVAGPSFSDRNNKLVYEETTQLTMELFDRWATEGKVIKVEDAVTVTSKLSVMINCIAGFGYRFGWDETEAIPAGHKMTFRTALSTLFGNFPTRVLFSDFILQFNKTGREVVTAFKELGVYMREMIRERSQSVSEDSEDLFTNLVRGSYLNSNGNPANRLSDEELMGNVFTFLFAGHETTAHSLGFTLALLAIYPDIQERALRELLEIVPEGEVPTYGHIQKWRYGLAVMHESLRMFPPILVLLRYAAQDTVLTTSSADGKNTPIRVPIPQGTDIVINIAGLHYNPKYWDHPEEFRPERFLKDYNRDAFMPWGAGTRSCIGRRFSETDSTTFLANLILKYQFKVTPISGTETPAQMKERVLRWRHGLITISPEKVPLTFTRRDK